MYFYNFICISPLTLSACEDKKDSAANHVTAISSERCSVPMTNAVGCVKHETAHCEVMNVLCSNAKPVG